ncbi:tetratricopeptide repeat-containing sensor histidine kinase [Aquimarina sp. 2201CG14-23]|uniref:tetratricopeptide repeat-containing sensor histidine kinase n=1 Tax=Aquimarina mycalae TaxID=3040073 RepID=UPI0024780885|nr:tetratricopeptide repeat protein [Aquimarina sp. 2201CG14-23]MDH7447569.1 tetratricopeptide repeat protein [Aquimarina sp. 2201CG14-23]
MSAVNKYILFLFSLCFFVIHIQAQDKKIDSLKVALKNHIEKDTVRVNLLNELAFNYYTKDINISQLYVDEAEVIIKNINYKKGKARNLYVKGSLRSMKGDFKSSIQYYEEALELYKTINFKKGISDCYDALGVIARFQNDYKKSIEFIEEALRIKKEIGHTEHIPDNLNFLGAVNSIMGNYTASLQYSKDALKLFEKEDDKKGMARCFEIIGDTYQKQGNYPVALEYLNKSIYLKEKNNDLFGLHNILNNIGAIYEKQEYPDKALEYYNRALKICNENNFKRGIVRTSIYIGNLFKNKKEYTKAFTFLNRALEISQEINDSEHIGFSLNYIGSVYRSLKKISLARECYKKAEHISLESENLPTLCNSYRGLANTFLDENKNEKALFYALKSKEIANKLNSLSQKKRTSYLLFKIYENTKEYKKALASHEEYKKLNDSLFNRENIQKIAELEYEYKYKSELELAEKKELKLTKTVKTTSRNLEKSQRNLLLGVIAFLITTIILGTIIFFLKFRNEKSKTQNIIIEQKLLRSQMTPHFIFNSLSVLQGMILNKEEKNSVSYLSKFSKLLRITLENSRDKTVSLTQELIAVQNYLELQNIEAEKSYIYSISVDDVIDSSLFKIPPMLIQPFIENAIEHGFKNQKDNKEIDVLLTYTNKELRCVIKDNGIGIAANQVQENKHKKSLATTITSERLQMLSKDFKMKGSVTVEDRKKYNKQGTIVTLVIPHKLEQA